MFLTFNTTTSNKTSLKPIIIHRKKQTNTLYTINALNRVIEQQNDGVLDMNFNVNWDFYTNSLLLTNDGGELKRINTRLYDII